MQSDPVLNQKCPACGSITPKTLSAIKLQRSFDCDGCGYHAILRKEPLEKPAKQRVIEEQAIPA